MNPGTARKTNHRSLRQSQRHASPIPSPGDEHVVEVDAHGVCVNVWATRGGSELGDRILDRKISEVVDEEIYRSIQPVFRRVIKTEQSEAFEPALPEGSDPRRTALHFERSSAPTGSCISFLPVCSARRTMNGGISPRTCASASNNSVDRSKLPPPPGKGTTVRVSPPELAPEPPAMEVSPQRTL
jgi:hypothetical protein